MMGYALVIGAWRGCAAGLHFRQASVEAVDRPTKITFEMRDMGRQLQAGARAMIFS
jgi:hypothetical protein